MPFLRTSLISRFFAEIEGELVYCFWQVQLSKILFSPAVAITNTKTDKETLAHTMINLFRYFCIISVEVASCL